MKLTREQAIKEHRKMWNWIADETLKRKKCVDKKDYFGEHPEYEEFLCVPVCFCWCCEYDSEKLLDYVNLNKDGEQQSCSFCPIDFHNSDFYRKCLNDESVFTEWLRSFDYNYEQAAKYARMIAELPERKEE